MGSLFGRVGLLWFRNTICVTRHRVQIELINQFQKISHRSLNTPLDARPAGGGGLMRWLLKCISGLMDERTVEKVSVCGWVTNFINDYDCQPWCCSTCRGTSNSTDIWLLLLLLLLLPWFYLASRVWIGLRLIPVTWTRYEMKRRSWRWRWWLWWYWIGMDLMSRVVQINIPTT